MIDAGISCRETEKRMKRVGLLMSSVKAIFVSHEHADHISGIPVLCKKYQLPVYITQGTHKESRMRIEKHLIMPFRAYEPVMIGRLSVNAFPKFHDAADPHSFIVSDNAITVGVFTDIGRNCERVIHHFKQCNAAFLEANFDMDMLTNGSYPYHLKKRISGGNGHLSNKEALDLFNTHRPPYLSHLVLSHLSKNNNTPEIVEKLFTQYAGTTKIIIASRYEETKVYEVTNTSIPVVKVTKPLVKQQAVQLSIF